ncbi:hypothetical protein NPIL_21541 [Nephila pilipes]|uniref:Uncharacterized protein n=1 Tax=Nephila pilipes TaxID=299642 RepID=A0A8X6PZI3_NEPPI|nr:hypothetical protein NPIL_21541 [Nephila pilipes]
MLISSACFVKNNSASSWEASVSRESVIGPTAVAAGFTEDSPFAFSSTAFAVEGGESWDQKKGGWVINHRRTPRDKEDVCRENALIMGGMAALPAPANLKGTRLLKGGSRMGGHQRSREDIRC